MTNKFSDGLQQQDEDQEPQREQEHSETREANIQLRPSSLDEDGQQAPSGYEQHSQLDFEQEVEEGVGYVDCPKCKIPKPAILFINASKPKGYTYVDKQLCEFCAREQTFKGSINSGQHTLSTAKEMCLANFDKWMGQLVGNEVEANIRGQHLILFLERETARSCKYNCVFRLMFRIRMLTDCVQDHEELEEVLDHACDKLLNKNKQNSFTRLRSQLSTFDDDGEEESDVSFRPDQGQQGAVRQFNAEIDEEQDERLNDSGHRLRLPKRYRVSSGYSPLGSSKRQRKRLMPEEGRITRDRQMSLADTRRRSEGYQSVDLRISQRRDPVRETPRSSHIMAEDARGVISAQNQRRRQSAPAPMLARSTNTVAGGEGGRATGVAEEETSPNLILSQMQQRHGTQTNEGSIAAAIKAFESLRGPLIELQEQGGNEYQTIKKLMRQFCRDLKDLRDQVIDLCGIRKGKPHDPDIRRSNIADEMINEIVEDLRGADEVVEQHLLALGNLKGLTRECQRFHDIIRRSFRLNARKSG